jgi:hypothetical protein
MFGLKGGIEYLFGVPPIAVLTVESSTPDRLCRPHDNKIIFRAELVGACLMVIGIIFPVPIHHEEIFICSGKEIGCFFPLPVFVFFHGMDFGIPLVEVSHEYDLFGIRRRQGEGYFAPFGFLFRFNSGHGLPPFVKNVH